MMRFMDDRVCPSKLTEAICRQTDGSRTDGKKWLQLPFPVMRFDVNFPTVDHSEVASDADRFTGLFLTYYCKALSNAFDDKMDFHNKMINSYLRALGGLSSTPSDLFQKNRVSISLENKYPVVIKHRELASSQSLQSILSVQM